MTNFEIIPLNAQLVELILDTDGGAAWHRDRQKWEDYLQDHQKKERFVIVATSINMAVGYANLLWQSDYEPFRNLKIPEIKDLVVAGSFRKNGAATAMVSFLESKAIAAGCETIGLAVGLYADYGPAQRLYTKIGYVPDGRGITANSFDTSDGKLITGKNMFVPPGTRVTVDDGLTIWMVKRLPITTLQL